MSVVRAVQVDSDARKRARDNSPIQRLDFGVTLEFNDKSTSLCELSFLANEIKVASVSLSSNRPRNQKFDLSETVYEKSQNEGSEN